MIFKILKKKSKFKKTRKKNRNDKIFINVKKNLNFQIS